MTKLLNNSIQLQSTANELFAKRTILDEHVIEFIDITSFLSETATPHQRLWHVINDTIDVPTCTRCGKLSTKFVKSLKSYSEWCSAKCMGTDPAILLKKSQTNQAKYGGHPMHNETIRETRNAATMEKYGVDNVFKSLEIKEKIKQRNLEKYGVDNAAKNDMIKLKISQSSLNRNWDDVIDKRHNTCIEKFGVSSNKHIHLTNENIDKLHNLEFLIEQHVTLKKPCSQIAEELGCSPTPILKRLVAAGIDIQRFNVSAGETNLVDFLSNYTQNIIRNDRTIIAPRELDIFLPDFNLAIEFNGSFWHSELHGKSKQYHVSKTVACEQQNIQLIQIWDYEWNTQTDIIKSKLLHKLNKSTKIFARNCSIIDVSSTDKRNFLNENHIQGDCSSSVNIGAMFDGELVSLATFAKARYTSAAQWELIRFCNKLNTTVVGAGSKLIKHFIKLHNPSSIVSYADRRWSTGNLYTQLGFEFIHDTDPNYWYFLNSDPSRIMSRIKFQKHKLSKLLEVVDLSKTEWENMKNNNYDRIWDCGNKTYIWKKHE
jgi:hypothetical protein